MSCLFLAGVALDAREFLLDPPSGIPVAPPAASPYPSPPCAASLSYDETNTASAVRYTL